MKKLFVTLMALTVLGGVAFAQNGAQAARTTAKVARAAKDAQAAVEAKKAEVLRNLDSFRKVTESRTEFNGSYVIQDMTYLMDSYIALAKESESAAVSLNEEINRPIQAGWGRTVTVAQLVRDNSHHVWPGSSTADDFDRFEFLLGKKPSVPVRVANKQGVSLASAQVEKTVAAAPKYADIAAVKAEAIKVFATYFSLNPTGNAPEAAYKPLAELLTEAVSLNQMIARTSNVDDRENFAIQAFFSGDIPGKYAALKAVDPNLAAATNQLMNSFMDTVSNGAFSGGADHPDMKAMRAFKKDIGYRY